MAARTTTLAGWRAGAIGIGAAVLLIGGFHLAAAGATASGPGAGSAGPRAPAAGTAAAVSPARITVTGDGTVTGVPDQLLLSMGVQVSAASVAAALNQASQAASRVTAALRSAGVAASDIQTAGLSIQPNYQGQSQLPDGYGASESLTATLNRVAAAGGQIEAAVRAGGNATTVDGVTLNLADTSGLLASARAAALADARVKAAQYARALGEPLGPVLSITDQTAPVQPLSGLNAPVAGPVGRVPISAGTQQLSVSITVVYAA